MKHSARKKRIGERLQWQVKGELFDVTWRVPITACVPEVFRADYVPYAALVRHWAAVLARVEGIPYDAAAKRFRTRVRAQKWDPRIVNGDDFQTGPFVQWVLETYPAFYDDAPDFLRPFWLPMDPTTIEWHPTVETPRPAGQRASVALPLDYDALAEAHRVLLAQHHELTERYAEAVNRLAIADARLADHAAREKKRTELRSQHARKGWENRKSPNK